MIFPEGKPRKAKQERPMKTKLTKTIIGSFLCACALATLVTAMAQGTSTAARKEDAAMPHCGAHTLRGSYIFATHGWNISGGVAIPKAIVEGIDFAENGTLVSPFATVSIDGTIVRSSGSQGTYTLQEDCTGTLTFTGGPSFDIFVQPSGDQLWMIQTGGPGPAVFQGTVTRVSH
jgi:hypothetical protein